MKWRNSVKSGQIVEIVLKKQSYQLSNVEMAEYHKSK